MLQQAGGFAIFLQIVVDGSQKLRRKAHQGLVPSDTESDWLGLGRAYIIEMLRSSMGLGWIVGRF